MAMPVKPTPLPSSRTVLRAQEDETAVRSRITWRTSGCSWRDHGPAGEELPPIQSPLRQVERGLPGHQAGGPLRDQGDVFQQADGAATGLQDESDTRIMTSPEQVLRASAEVLRFDFLLHVIATCQTSKCLFFKLFAALKRRRNVMVES